MASHNQSLAQEEESSQNQSSAQECREPNATPANPTSADPVMTNASTVNYSAMPIDVQQNATDASSVKGLKKEIKKAMSGDVVPEEHKGFGSKGFAKAGETVGTISKLFTKASKVLPKSIAEGLGQAGGVVKAMTAPLTAGAHMAEGAEELGHGKKGDSVAGVGRIIQGGLELGSTALKGLSWATANWSGAATTAALGNSTVITGGSAVGAAGAGGTASTAGIFSVPVAGQLLAAAATGVGAGLGLEKLGRDSGEFKDGSGKNLGAAEYSGLKAGLWVQDKFDKHLNPWNVPNKTLADGTYIGGSGPSTGGMIAGGIASGVAGAVGGVYGNAAAISKWGLKKLFGKPDKNQE